MLGLRHWFIPLALSLIVESMPPEVSFDPPLLELPPDAACSPEPAPETGAADTPDAGGRYHELVRVVPASSQDILNYHGACDYGIWDGDSWNGCTDLPPAYWVLHRGSWYLWAGQTGEEQDATAGGRYSSLLRAFHSPEEQEQFGDFADRGYWDGSEWSGRIDLPSAYWVYWRGTWYLWGECRER